MRGYARVVRSMLTAVGNFGRALRIMRGFKGSWEGIWGHGRVLGGHGRVLGGHKMA